MEAIVLAGGKGTRLQSRVRDVPKPMAPVRSSPFLEHLFRYWIDQGVTRFILSVGHLHEKISSRFGDRFETASLSYALEREPLGTGGGALLALQQVRSNGPTLLLNGDSFLELRLKDMLAFHVEKKSSLTLSLTSVAENTRYGAIRLDPTGRCLDMLPSPAPGPADVNAGVYLFDPAFLARSKAPKAAVSLEKDLIPAWIERGEAVFGWKTGGRFIDIGTPDDFDRAELFFEE